MGDYQPTSRRPIADMFRLHGQRRGPILRAAGNPSRCGLLRFGRGFGPGGRSVSGGPDELPALLIPAALLCYLRLWLNMLDGMVALASGKASLRGELLNDLPDRVSDVIIFAGVAHSGLCHPASGYWAAILALLTAYVGTFGQALGVGRQFGGIMAKPWRMVVLARRGMDHAGTACGRAAPIDLGPLTVLDWTNLVVVAGCVETIAVRLAAHHAGSGRETEA